MNKFDIFNMGFWLAVIAALYYVYYKSVTSNSKKDK